MAQQFPELAEAHRKFIAKQKIFFVATAARDGHVNLSPKGHDSLRVTGPRDIVWMNLTGSGNETAAQIADINRITLMWCAFEGPPLIMRVYGSARAIHPRDAEWAECAALIATETGSRQYFKVAIDLVQTSCGYAVPLFDYDEDRQVLREWADRRGEAGIAAYWAEANQTSLDGLPTGILG